MTPGKEKIEMKRYISIAMLKYGETIFQPIVNKGENPYPLTPPQP